jgi:hypothetical protein
MFQWTICANGNRYLGVCARCDIKVNAWALKFFRVPGGAALLCRYRARVAKPGHRPYTRSS